MCGSFSYPCFQFPRRKTGSRAGNYARIIRRRLQIRFLPLLRAAREKKFLLGTQFFARNGAIVIFLNMQSMRIYFLALAFPLPPPIHSLSSSWWHVAIFPFQGRGAVKKGWSCKDVGVKRRKTRSEQMPCNFCAFCVVVGNTDDGGGREVGGCVRISLVQ